MSLKTEQEVSRIIFQFSGGKITGGDIAYNIVTKQGEDILDTVPGPAKMIGVGDWDGVDLEEVSSIINTALTEQNAELSQSIATLRNEKEGLQASVTELTQSCKLQSVELERLSIVNTDMNDSLSATLLDNEKLKKLIKEASQLEDMEAIKQLLLNVVPTSSE